MHRDIRILRLSYRLHNLKSEVRIIASEKEYHIATIR